MDTITDDMETTIQKFIDTRDAIKIMEDKHKEDMKKYRARMDKLSGDIQEFLDKNNLENVKTKAGTCYLSTRRTASLADPEAFMNYVIEHEAFDLMDRRANSTAVQDFVKKHKALPPGCNLNSVTTVGVLRAGAPKPE